MKSVIRIFVRAAVLALLCIAPSAFAQQVTLQLNDPPSNNILADVYVGSYSGFNTQTGAGVQVICDDFNDESNYQPWTYTVNNFSNLGSTIWGQYLTSVGQGSQITNMYEEAAWLALQMVGLTGTQQGYYSFATWAIFAPNQVAAWLTSYSTDNGAACNAVFGTNSWSGGVCHAGKSGLVGQAIAALPSFYAGEFANLLILTPNGCTSPGSCREQEFFVVATEGGAAAMYLLLASFSCFAAIFFRSRRQRPDRRIV
jgi:hypothetical protein